MCFLILLHKFYQESTYALIENVCGVDYRNCAQ